MYRMKEESLKLKTTVALILLIFFLTCIVVSFYCNQSLLLGSFDKFNNDDVKYIRSAQTLIDTGRLTYNYVDKDSVFIMPGIVLTLVPFVKVFGMEGAVIPYRIFNAILQTFSLYMLFLIARKFLGNRIALIALILAVLYLPNIYATTQILTETAFLFLFMFLALFTIEAINQKKLRYYVLGGVFLGLCALFRPAIAAFPIVILVMWLVKKYTFMDMLKFGSVATLAFVIVMSPWWVRNYETFHQFIPFTLSSGNPALQGAFIYCKFDPAIIQKVIPPGLQYADDEIVNNNVESKLAKLVNEYNLKNRTLEYLLWITVIKTVVNFSLPYVWFHALNNVYILFIIIQFLIILLAILGLLKMKRKRALTSGILVCLLIPVYFDLIHLPFLPFARYLYPAMPFVLIFVAYFIDAVIQKNGNSTEKKLSKI